MRSEQGVVIKLILELRYNNVTYRIYKGKRNEWKRTQAEGRRVQKQAEPKNGVGHRSNKQ